MKKVFLALTIILISVASSYSQEGNAGGGFHRGGKAVQMKEQTKQHLKEKLKLTDSQVDSVANIQHDYQAQFREVNKNTSLSEDDRKAKVSDLEAARNARLKSVLSKEQAERIETMYEKMKEKKEFRPSSAVAPAKN